MQFFIPPLLVGEVAERSEVGGVIQLRITNHKTLSLQSITLWQEKAKTGYSRHFQAPVSGAFFFFFGVYCVLISNATVSQCAVLGNKSAGVYSLSSYPFSPKIFISLASVPTSQET